MPLPRRLAVPALLTTTALALAACGGDEQSGGATSAAPAPGGPTVGMKSLKFVPETLAVKVGDTVTWTNDESIPHNVVANEGADFKSKIFGEGGTYTFKVAEAGTIRYECTLHPGMVGTLDVSG